MRRAVLINSKEILELRNMLEHGKIDDAKAYLDNIIVRAELE